MLAIVDLPLALEVDHHTTGSESDQTCLIMMRDHWVAVTVTVSFTHWHTAGHISNVRVLRPPRRQLEGIQ